MVVSWWIVAVLSMTVPSCGALVCHHVHQGSKELLHSVTCESVALPAFEFPQAIPDVFYLCVSKTLVSAVALNAQR